MNRDLDAAKAAVVAVLLMHFLVSAEEQNNVAAYSLKGFVVGQSTLADFRSQFHHCAENCPDKVKRTNGTPVFAPFCSDTEDALGRTFRGNLEAQDIPAHTRVGLVYCSPYFPFEELPRGPLFTIADTPATTEFDFYQGKLYRISASFYAVRFSAMQEAFTGKYGAPSSTTNVEYQNRFAAKITGIVVIWDNGVSTITLRQYGSGSTDYSTLVVEHKSLTAEAEAARPKHTSKDL